MNVLGLLRDSTEFLKVARRGIWKPVLELFKKITVGACDRGIRKILPLKTLFLVTAIIACCTMAPFSWRY